MSFARLLLLCALLAGSCAAVDMTFTVSMPQPSNHTYHVTFRCAGLKGDLHDFKMPQWSPGYYGIGNYSRNVSNFHAEDASGRELAWEKVTRNTWRVVADGSPVVILNYDVFGGTAFAANSYLGEDRGYISPSGVFVHLAGERANAVQVRIQLPPVWKRISSGLEPVKGMPDTFHADNFDVLYDCPILMGNQEYLSFDVKGVPHFVAIENVPPEVGRAQMLADLKRIVTAVTDLMEDIPYKHYTFLMMGRGAGGIEHTNSSANQFDGTSLTKPGGYSRWLSFIAHEYFHNFNVKRIRPLALGPFDYDQENLTTMLWVSEGLSVYYQDLALVRAGLMTPEEYLAKLGNAIGAFENASGRRYQSATESSQNTWNSGSGVGGDRNTTISYYSNGAMLGAMLDLKIRASSGNRKSLDDVMRALYRKFYLQKKRGFSDGEFRAECEAAAGANLAEIFEYASTTKEVDYARYFALAGVKLDVTATGVPGGFIGLDARTEELPPSVLGVVGGAGARGSAGHGTAPAFKLMVTDAVPDSPAAQADLVPGDRILTIDGAPANPAALDSAINTKGPGQSITLRILRGGTERDVTITVAPNMRRTYKLIKDSVTPDQQRIFDSWLRRGL